MRYTSVTFRPDDTEKTFYIFAGEDFGQELEGLWDQAQKKWPGIRMDEISIEANHIQTRNIGYDRYDSSDYSNFLCIIASGEYFERIKKEKEKKEKKTKKGKKIK